MRNNSNFISIHAIRTQRKNSNLEAKFIPNKISVLRREKSRPENKLEPDLNEIQRFVKRGM